MHPDKNQDDPEANAKFQVKKVDIFLLGFFFQFLKEDNARKLQNDLSKTF